MNVPSRTHRLAFAALSLAALTASCAPAKNPNEWALVREVTPASLRDVGASDASVTVGPRGQVALTWVTRDSAGASVWVAVSTDSGERFGEPHRLDVPAGRVSSYAESRPVAAFGPTGALMVVWGAHRDSPFADDLVSRTSADGGGTFDQPVFVNDDHGDPDSPYRGFASIGFLPDGRALAAWIDGRGMEVAHGMGEPDRAMVRLAVSTDEGHSWQPSAVVDSEACPCCRVTLRVDSLGHVAIAFRDARNDLRDPRLAVSNDGGATFALDTLVSADGWKLPGCPSIGPSLTINRSGGGHYVWFTGAERESAGVTPGAYVVSWRPGTGAAGPRRALTDSLRDVARPTLAAMGSTSLAGVIARPLADSTRRVLAVRALDLDGTVTPWLFLGVNVRSAELAGAGPRRAYAAWSEKNDDISRLRLVRLDRR